MEHLAQFHSTNVSITFTITTVIIAYFYKIQILTIYQ